jgi:hypothetical protein
MSDFKWLAAEKKIARQAFDAPVNQECAAIIQKLKGLIVRHGPVLGWTCRSPKKS